MQLSFFSFLFSLPITIQVSFLFPFSSRFLRRGKFFVLFLSFLLFSCRGKCVVMSFFFLSLSQAKENSRWFFSFSFRIEKTYDIFLFFFFFFVEENSLWLCSSLLYRGKFMLCFFTFSVYFSAGNNHPLLPLVSALFFSLQKEIMFYLSIFSLHFSS